MSAAGIFQFLGKSMTFERQFVHELILGADHALKFGYSNRWNNIRRIKILPKPSFQVPNQLMAVPAFWGAQKSITSLIKIPSLGNLPCLDSMSWIRVENSFSFGGGRLRTSLVLDCFFFSSSKAVLSFI